MASNNRVGEEAKLLTQDEEQATQIALKRDQLIKQFDALQDTKRQVLADMAAVQGALQILEWVAKSVLTPTDEPPDEAALLTGAAPSPQQTEPQQEENKAP